VVAGLAGTAVLVSQRRTEPPPTRHDPDPVTGRPHRARGAAGSMRWDVLAPMTTSAFTMGMLFGGAEVATVAFSDEAGATSVSGVLLATWALGSLLSGAVVGAVHLRAASPARFRWGLLSLGLLMVPLPFVSGFWTLGAFMFLSGSAISPTLIAAAQWVEETVPPGRLTEGMTVFTTGLAAGVAPGAAVVGVVVDAAGASAAYWVPAAAGLTGAAVAFASAAVTGSLSARRPWPSGWSR
jgi:predicted MFS family arabinose efflux permease